MIGNAPPRWWGALSVRFVTTVGQRKALPEDEPLVDAENEMFLHEPEHRETPRLPPAREEGHRLDHMSIGIENVRSRVHLSPPSPSRTIAVPPRRHYIPKQLF